MKKLFFGICLAGTTMFLACGDGNVLILEDPSVQAAEDSAIIVNYLADLGYDADEVVTLESGVRYVIVNEGIGEAIDESDIVTFDYIGMLTNDTIFDTSIQEVGDSIRMVVTEDSVGKEDKSVHEDILSTFDEDKTYEPFTITYSGNGWTIEGRFIDGFLEGVSATFSHLKVGGESLILIPSSEAYGTSSAGSLIPPNSVLVFELYPTEVEKQ